MILRIARTALLSLAITVAAACSDDGAAGTPGTSSDAAPTAPPAPAPLTRDPSQPHRVNFREVFADNGNGSFSPRGPVFINGTQMGPGVSFGTGVSFGGVDIGALAGHTLLVRQQDGVTMILGND